MSDPTEKAMLHSLLFLAHEVGQLQNSCRVAYTWVGAEAQATSCLHRNPGENRNYPDGNQRMQNVAGKTT